MEQLEAYISQARQQGQTDEQIRQTLLATGWSAEQLSGVLPAPSAPQLVATVQHAAQAGPPVAVGQPASQPVTTPMQPQTVVHKRSAKRSVALLCLCLFILVVAGSSYAVFGRGTSYQTVIHQFVQAIEDNNKTKADSLESTAFKAEVKKYASTTSFYSACQQEGALCTASFMSSFLSSATKTYTSYTASNGTKGKELVYTKKQTLSGTQAGGTGCSSTSTTTLSIAVIPSGHSWLVDNINDGTNASGNMCLAPGGTASSGNTTQ